MKSFVKILACAAVLGLSAACTTAGSPPVNEGPVVESPLEGATLYMRRLVNAPSVDGEPQAVYAFRWTPPTLGPNNQPIAGYDLQILLKDSVVVDRRKGSAAVADTVGLPLPPLDSVAGPYKAQIRTRDTKGRVSVWIVTNEWGITHEGDAPPPPAGFTVDTVAPSVAAIIIRPKIDSLEVGEHRQLCGMVVMSDGTTGLADNPGSLTPECQAEYAAWQKESFGSPNLVSTGSALQLTSR